MSREWVNADAGGEEIACSRPWDTLKINLFNETKVCCSFFTKLPVFDWVAADEFHDEGRMWNNPFMQHLRSSMGTAQEVSYCTLCMTQDKRDPRNSERLAKVTAESLAVYRKLTALKALRGSIDQIPGSLRSWSFMSRVGPAQLATPFGNDKHLYRDVVRKHGFGGRGVVLQIGVGPYRKGFDSMADYPIAPFLAEANDRLLVCGDPFAVELCDMFGLAAEAIPGSLANVVDLDDASVDGIWLHGDTLYGLVAADAFDELRSLLRPGGRLHIHRARGLGWLIRRALGDGIPAAKARLAIASAAMDDGIVRYLSRRGLPRTLETFGLALDNSWPLKVEYASAGPVDPDLAHMSLGDMAERLCDESFRAELRASPQRLAGLETSITFNARLA